MKTSKIHKNVIIGKNTIIEDFCIIGKPAQGEADGEKMTVIGDNSIIRSHTVIYAGNVIGNNFSTGHHVVIRENNSIGDNVSVGSFSDIEHDVLIENNVRCHSRVFIPEYSEIKKNAWIGPHVVFTNAKYPKSKDVKKRLQGPLICEGAKIGANTTLLPGVTIGKNTLIGAGSTVIKNVPDEKVFAGSPAKEIKDISEIDEYSDGKGIS